MNHRTPPKPEAWDAERGICRWCGCCIVHLRGPDKGKPNFKRWHNRCVEEYKFIFWPNHTRMVLLKERGEKCEDCGNPIHYRRRLTWVDNSEGGRFRTFEDTAEHHHIMPLIDYQHDPADPYAAWKRENIVLVCHKCHLLRGQAIRDEKKPQMRLAI